MPCGAPTSIGSCRSHYFYCSSAPLDNDICLLREVKSSKSATIVPPERYTAAAAKKLSAMMTDKQTKVTMCVAYSTTGWMVQSSVRLSGLTNDAEHAHARPAASSSSTILCCVAAAVSAHVSLQLDGAVCRKTNGP